MPSLHTFSWIGPGGIENLRFIVVQIGKTIQIIDTSVEPYSEGVIYQERLDTVEENPRLSFATVNSELVVATNQPDILIYSYDGTNISKRVGRIKIRDMFGVEDKYKVEDSPGIGGIIGEEGMSEEDPEEGTEEEIDLTEGLGLLFRPTVPTDAHIYNLRNQTWALPAYKTTDRISDMVNGGAFGDAIGRFPSNSDNSNYAMAPEPAAKGKYNPQADRFWVQTMRNPVGTHRAPMGHFIIDALHRGQSRLSEAAYLRDLYGLSYPIGALPLDSTKGGARFVAEYAGRVFYSGFSDIVYGPDSKSPKLSSYVMFSQLVRTPDDAFKCYQDGDPTSKDLPDLVDTDGGFIRLSGASNICAMINLGKSLMVFAENGVWMISGNGDDGFTANNQMVTKITERGTKYSDTIVTVDGTAMYWSEDGIYHLRQNEYGDWGASSLTEDTIQSFYADISSEERLYCKGLYDSYDKKVRWVYNNFIDASGPSKELVFDVQLGAFYPNEIETLKGLKYPRVCSLAIIPPFRVGRSQEPITHEAQGVVYNGEPVIYPSLVEVSATKEVAYLSVYSYNSGTLDYGFTTYSNTDFRDWVEVDGVGVDAEAVLVTGYLSGGDFSRNKQVPYINFHLERTERGFRQEGDGGLTPIGESSCIVQSQWSWNNSPVNGKWGEPFQAYRYRRSYTPYGPTDNYDSGETIISTRNKLRGMGKVLSLKINTEPYKDLKLVGWSVSMDMNANV